MTHDKTKWVKGNMVVNHRGRTDRSKSTQLTYGRTKWVKDNHKTRIKGQSESNTTLLWDTGCDKVGQRQLAEQGQRTNSTQP